MGAVIFPGYLPVFLCYIQEALIPRSEKRALWETVLRAHLQKLTNLKTQFLIVLERGTEALFSLSTTVPQNHCQIN